MVLHTYNKEREEEEKGKKGSCRKMYHKIKAICKMPCNTIAIMSWAEKTIT